MLVSNLKYSHLYLLKNKYKNTFVGVSYSYKNLGNDLGTTNSVRAFTQRGSSMITLN